MGQGADVRGDIADAVALGRERGLSSKGAFLAAAFFIIVAVFGGASRFPSPGDLVVRLAAVAVLAWVIASGPLNWLPPRRPLLFIGAVMLLPLLQLVPLPPSTWSNIGGRAVYVQAYKAAGIDLAPLPISLAPIRTWDAFLFLLVPLAALAVTLRLGIERQGPLLIGILLAAGLSALVSLLQAAGGDQSSFHLYDDRIIVSSTGFFANRNHFAVFIACLIVLICWWYRFASGKVDHGARLLLTGTGLTVAITLLVLTESRAGAGLALLALSLSALAYIVPGANSYRLSLRSRLGAALLLVVPLGIGGIVGFPPLADRFAALHETSRQLIAPVVLDMTREVQPWGTGMGSFSEVFKAFEDMDAITRAYWNQVHNEIVQLAIEGGIAAMLLALIFLVWWMTSAWRVVRLSGSSIAGGLGQAGAIITSLLLLHSMVDYPLRTPALASFFGIACGWMLLAIREAHASETEQPNFIDNNIAAAGGKAGNAQQLKSLRSAA